MEGTFYPNEEYLAHIGNWNSGRYRRGSGKNPFQHVKEGAEKWLAPSIKSGKDKPQQSPAEKTTKEVARGINEAANVAGKMSEMKRRGYKSNAKNMTDAELNESIRRMRLEQEYDRLTAGTMNTGYDKIQDILSIAGGIAGIGASAATIAGVVHNMRHGKAN